MDPDTTHTRLREHLRNFFKGHEHKKDVWTPGPAATELPRLSVSRFGPGPRTGLWVYVSVGAWEARAGLPLEFLIVAPKADRRHVELLSMAAWYHGRYGLGLEHTLPIGEPWIPGSTCEFLLVSKPYPFGPELEICAVADKNLHILWLLPITRAEREFKIQHGADALERKFDDARLEFWNPQRPSVVD